MKYGKVFSHLGGDGSLRFARSLRLVFTTVLYSNNPEPTPLERGKNLAGFGRKKADKTLFTARFGGNTRFTLVIRNQTAVSS
jgi:hypothetical protein